MSEQKKDKEKLLIDIFQEASQEIFESSYDTVIVNTIQDHNIAKKESTMTPLEVKTWEDLKIAMETCHVERFNQILNELPDREFVKVWLRAVPFFKLHPSKEKQKAPSSMQQINITVNRTGEEEESKIITVN